jgi:hypothetical protein
MRLGEKLTPASGRPFNNIFRSFHDDRGRWVGRVHHVSVVIDNEVIARFEPTYENGYDAPAALDRARKLYRKEMKKRHGRVFYS